MRLILVDDEPLILRGMLRTLRRGFKDCDIRAFESGEQALASLDAERCDLLITDMRMPLMDGAELLERVRQAHPVTIRVVLTGDMDDKTVVRATPHMHQLLAKPCTPTELEDTVNRAAAMHTLLSNERLRSALGGLGCLPSVPRIFLELQATLDDAGSSSADIARILESDPALCSKLLQLANSTYFGPPCPVTSAEEGVRRIGVRMLQGLALSLAAFEAARKEALPAWVDVDALQGLALRRVAIAHRLVRGHRELALCATLADVGLLALASCAPELAAQIGELKDAGMPLAEAERAIVGVTHAEIGGYLLGVWGLPLAVVEAIAWQHRPGDAAAPDKTLVAMLHVTAQVAAGLPVDEASLTRAGLHEEARAWQAAARRQA